MSLYNLLFGTNPQADVLLAALGLSRGDVGRFRDTFIDGQRQLIAVYTRNGGGNRDCWCDGSEHKDIDGKPFVWASHDSPVKVRVELGDPDVEEHDGFRISKPSGRTKIEEQPVCQKPDSAECGCVGCFMTYRVHELPHYSHDRDDDFDSTYATIFFRFPPEFADGLRAIADEKAWDPDERWSRMLEAVREGRVPTPPAVAAALRKLSEVASA